MNHRAIAADVFARVVAELTSSSGTPDLVSVARRLERACGLLGWQDEVESFRSELSGYAASSVPQYRNAQCAFRWAPEVAGHVMPSPFDTLVPPGHHDEWGRWPLPGGLAELEQRAAAGYGWWSTEETRPSMSTAKGGPTIMRRRAAIPAFAVVEVLNKIEQKFADFAIEVERQLVFGNLASDIFSEYRNLVEVELGKLGISELSAIETNIRSATPAAASLAIMGCRNVLERLSQQLWQVSGLPAHPTATNKAGGKLQLGATQPKARLRCYLIERGIQLTEGKKPTLLAGQLDRVADTIDELYDLASKKGKNEASIEDARAAALQLYLLIGEMVRLAGLEPVTLIMTPPATEHGSHRGAQ